jgi:hypothetical protein
MLLVEDVDMATNLASIPIKKRPLALFLMVFATASAKSINALQPLHYHATEVRQKAGRTCASNDDGIGAVCFIRVHLCKRTPEDALAVCIQATTRRKKRFQLKNVARQLHGSFVRAGDIVVGGGLAGFHVTLKAVAESQQCL